MPAEQAGESLAVFENEHIVENAIKHGVGERVTCLVCDYRSGLAVGAVARATQLNVAQCRRRIVCFVVEGERANA